MDDKSQSDSPRRGTCRRILGLLLNPYLQIFLGAMLDTAGQVLLKKGAAAVGPSNGIMAEVGFAPLASLWTWLGIIAYVLSTVSWLYVLRTVPVSVAFSLISVIYLLVPLSSKVFLHEHISALRWAGIGLVLLGVVTVVRPLVRATEQL